MLTGSGVFVGERENIWGIDSDDGYMTFWMYLIYTNSTIAGD